jgi:hypothetical protein
MDCSIIQDQDVAVLKEPFGKSLINGGTEGGGVVRMGVDTVLDGARRRIDSAEPDNGVYVTKVPVCLPLSLVLLLLSDPFAQRRCTDPRPSSASRLRI